MFARHGDQWDKAELKELFGFGTANGSWLKYVRIVKERVDGPHHYDIGDISLVFDPLLVRFWSNNRLSRFGVQ